MTLLRFAPALLVALVASFPLPAPAWNRLEVDTFAVLPAGTTHPEGITADAVGNLYVTTFEVGDEGPGTLLVFAPDGKLLRRLAVNGSSAQLLGLAFHRDTGELLVIDFGGQQVLRVNPLSGESSVFAVIPGGA